jgi:hypothetical protein
VATLDGGTSGAALNVVMKKTKTNDMKMFVLQIMSFSVETVSIPGFEKTIPDVPKPNTITMKVATSKADASPYSLTGNHLLITMFFDPSMIEPETARVSVPIKIGQN